MITYKVDSDWKSFEGFIKPLGGKLGKNNIGVRHNYKTEVFVRCTDIFYNAISKKYILKEVEFNENPILRDSGFAFFGNTSFF